MNNDGNDVFRAGRSRGCMLGGRQAAWRNPWTGSLVLPGAPIQPPPPMLDLVPDAEITPPMLEPARRSRDGSQDCSLQQRRLCRDATQDHDIWLLFTINTYLMPEPPICPSLCPRVWENLVSLDWFRPPAKCLDLMRVGNPDKCSIIRGNRKTRWISAEDLLCVNTKIYQVPTKERGGEAFLFLFSFETFSFCSSIVISMLGWWSFLLGEDIK